MAYDVSQAVPMLLDPRVVSYLACCCSPRWRAVRSRAYLPQRSAPCLARFRRFGVGTRVAVAGWQATAKTPSMPGLTAVISTSAVTRPKNLLPDRHHLAL